MSAAKINKLMADTKVSQRVSALQAAIAERAEVNAAGLLKASLAGVVGLAMACIEQYVKDRAVNRFTTADIARFMGVEEYPVRAAVSWLARYGLIEIIPGVRSRRYLGQPADATKRRHADRYFASVYQVKERCIEVNFAALLEAAELAEALLVRQKWRPDGTDPEAVCLRKLREAIAGVRGGGDSSPAPAACQPAADDLPPRTPQPELVMPSASKAWRQGDAVAELQSAHQIIRNALSIMTAEQKSEWGWRNARDGVDGEGITRANEREAIFSTRSEKPAAN